MKRRFLAILLAFALISTLVSCAAELPAEESVEEPVIEEKTDIKAAVCWYDYTDAFLSTVREDMNEAFENLGIEYTNYDAESSQATQNEQIEKAVAAGANFLVVNIVDTAATEAAQGIVDKARDADISVVFFNREVDDNIINSYDKACYVGTRPREASEQQGIMIGEYILENYDAIDLNGDGCISYILLEGELGSAEPIRTPRVAVEFCNDILIAKGKPAMKYFDPENIAMAEYSNWSKTEAFEIMKTALSRFPMDSEQPIEIVVTNNDDASLGCVEALNNVSWNTGKGSFIPVFGVDYTADAAAAIERGSMAGSVRQSTEGLAATVAALMQNVIDGNNVFDGAKEQYNVDETVAKIRVPYEVIVTDIKPEKIVPKVIDARLIWDDFGNMEYSELRRDLEDELFENGIKYMNHDCIGSQGTQKNAVETAVDEGADILVVCMVEPSNIIAAQYIVDTARAADVPVIFVGGAVDDIVLESYEKASYSGRYASGVGVAEQIIEWLDVE